ncbi:MAG: hypothetical protein WD825_15200 [Gemmatimonadaceae bacterium]
MYSTCLFCNEDLGKNEVIEHFPIGRRLAYDAAKGRLWVVCRKCERWNLTPLEERWEAIEEAERLFSDTRLRASTDNIGLAKLREGLELVRIGTALRPEMAAWRYGDQFGRRRRNHILLTSAGVAVVGGLVILGPATGIIAGGGWGIWQGISQLHGWYDRRRVRVRLRLPDHETVVPIRKKQLQHAALVTVNEEWALRVSLKKPAQPFEADTVSGIPRSVLFTGREALHAAAKLLPAINEKGAKTDEVQSAVTLIGEVADPATLFNRYAGAPPRPGRRRTSEELGAGHRFDRFPKEVRLALEMAAHEEQERRALEGELALLEAAWREAEEVAKIADDMFIPDDTNARLETLKREG